MSVKHDAGLHCVIQIRGMPSSLGMEERPVHPGSAGLSLELAASVSQLSLHECYYGSLTWLSQNYI